MRKLIALLVMATLTTAVLTTLGMAPASAADLPPTIHLDRAFVVARGAALEVSYTVTCPDNANGRHALWTTLPATPTSGVIIDYLEFNCDAAPRTITNLVSNRASAPAFSTSSRVIATHVTNCLYFDSTSEPVPGCYNVYDTSTIKAKTGKFAPESSVDIASNLDLVGARLVDGGVELTQVLTCNIEAAGFLFSTVTQAGGSGTAKSSAGFGAGALVECAAGETRTLTYVVPAQPGMGFQPGDSVIESKFTNCEEGCTRGIDTSLMRLRR